MFSLPSPSTCSSRDLHAIAMLRAILSSPRLWGILSFDNKAIAPSIAAAVQAFSCVKTCTWREAHNVPRLSCCFCQRAMLQLGEPSYLAALLLLRLCRTWPVAWRWHCADSACLSPHVVDWYKLGWQLSSKPKKEFAVAESGASVSLRCNL